MIPKEIQDRIDTWLNGPIDPESKKEILTLSRKNPKALEDAFYTSLNFGTGGMRGIMGVGTNRINLYTIQIATQGLANYILKQKPKKDKHYVFIGYDTRNHSKEFAIEAARVLAGNHIGVYLCFEFRPTPYVSFGVRQKECSAGIMITASHNPKEYNGYKVYWEDGGQVVAPHDLGILNEIKKITRLENIKMTPEKSPFIEILNPEFDIEYLNEVQKLQSDFQENVKAKDNLYIVYTPLHGTGIRLVPKALKSWGFSNIHLVEHQILPDGNFPTVKTPNPEDPQALAMGIDQLQKTRGDILLVTDPDADRIAVVCLHEDKPFPFNGNQIAAICLEYICETLSRKKRLPKNGACVTTIVSTDLLSVISKHYNISCHLVLTGFKYVAKLMQAWEKNLSHTFLFGAEESYGYLFGTYCRDKDAIIISCLIAQLAFLMKTEGKTLADFLIEIYKKYGFFWEKQKTLSFPSNQEGKKKMQDILDTLRTKHPKNIANIPVTFVEDYLPGIKGLPPSNALLYRLKDDTKIIIRPSGTEPKLKIYACMHEPTFQTLPIAMQTANEKLEKLFHAIEALF